MKSSSFTNCQNLAPSMLKVKKQLLLFLTFLFLFGFQFSSQLNAQENCGTPSPSGQEASRILEQRQAALQGRAFVPTGTLQVNLQPHLIAGSGNTAADVMNEISAGIAYYAVHNITFNVLPVNIINDSALINLGSNSSNGITEGHAMASVHNTQNVLNMYFHDEIWAQSGANFFRIGGYARFPWNAEDYTTIAGGNVDGTGATVAHEAGHYFGLLHTFEPFFGSENVTRTGPNANCTLAGDLLCDTPADHNQWIAGCDYRTGVLDPVGTEYAPAKDLIMSYNLPFTCVDKFSADSEARMRFYMGNDAPETRRNLFAPTAVCQNYTAQLDPNGSVTITADKVDGGSTDPNNDALTLSVSPDTFNGTGTFPVTLTVTDPNGFSDTCSASVTVEEAPCATTKIYWGSAGFDFGLVGDGAVNSMDTDGSNKQYKHVAHTSGHGRSLAVDPNLDLIFYSSWNPLDPSSGGGIYVHDLVGGGVTQIHNASTSGIPDVELDVNNQRIYWTDFDAGEIRSASYDAAGNLGPITTEVSGRTNPFGLALDISPAGVVNYYWSETTNWNAPGFGGSVYTADSTGAPVTTLASGYARVDDVELDPLASTLYFNNWASGPGNASSAEGIYRVNTDGTGLVQITSGAQSSSPTGNASGLHGIVLDPISEVIYFTRHVSYANGGGGGEVSSVNYDGTGYTQLNTPGDGWFLSGIELRSRISITCPADIPLECAANLDTTPTATGSATATGGCGDVTVSFTDSSVAGCGNTEIITRTWTATDAAGNSASCDQIITVQDNTPPTFTAPADTEIFADASCNYDTDVLFTGDVENEDDNCDADPQATFVDAAPVPVAGCPGSFTIERTWSLEDACGNAAADQVQLITVTDNTGPVLTRAAGNQTVSCDDNSLAQLDFWLETAGGAKATDNCSAVSWTNNFNGLTDLCGLTGDVTVRFYAVDECGNQSEFFTEARFVIEDITPPTFTRPADITLYKDADCLVDDTPQGLAGDVSDEFDSCHDPNNPDLNATFSDVVTPGCEGAYVITRTWSLSDDCDNPAADQVQTITVVDEIVPTFTAPADVTLYKDAACEVDDSPQGLAGDVIDEADNCTTVLNATFSDVVVDNCEGTYTITRTWSLVDDCDNAAADQVQIITVLDEIVPTIDTPASDLTVECGPDNEQQLQDWLAANGNAVASDNCTSIVDWSNNYNSSTEEVFYSTGNDGTSLVKTDLSSGLTTTIGGFGYGQTWALAFTPDGNAYTIINGFGSAQLASVDLSTGAATPIGSPLGFTCISIDSDSSGQLYAVGYNNANLYTIDATTGIATLVGATGIGNNMDLAFDNSDNLYATVGNNLYSVDTSNATSNVISSISGASFVMGLAISANNTFYITEYINNSGLFTLDPITGVATLVGNTGINRAHGGDTFVTASDGVSLSDLCGATGAVTVDFTATDDCGNASTTSATFTIEDTTDPTFTVPADITLYKDEDCLVDDSPQGLAGDVTDEDDICSGDLEATHTDVVVDNCEGTYTITRTWTLVDDCDNTTTKDQIITVLDIINPTIDTPASDMTVECGPDNEQQLQDWLAAHGGAVASDNCSTIDDTNWSYGCYADPEEKTGFTLLGVYNGKAYYLSDSAMPATAALPDAVNNGGFAATINDAAENTWVYNAVVAAAGGNIRYYIGYTDTDTENVFQWQDGDTSTYTNWHNGEPNDLFGEDCAEVGFFNSSTWNDIDCTTANRYVLEVDATSIPCEPSDECGATGSVTANFTVTDDCGNASTTTATFTIEDTTDPTFTVPADITLYKDEDCLVDDSPQGLAGDVTDEDDFCSGDLEATFSDVVVDNCEGTYTITRTWTLVDDCGNTTTQDQIITVLDEIVPTFTAPADITLYVDENCFVDDTPNGDAGDVIDEDDNCSTNLNATFGDVVVEGCPGSYVITRTWSLKDNCGNQAADQVQIITVEDNTPPALFRVAADQTVLCDGEGNTEALNTWLSTNGGAKATDNCSIVSWTHNYGPDNPLSDLCGATGVVYVTFTATDECGNSSSSTAKFTIEDPFPPTFTAPADITLYKDENCAVDDSPQGLAGDVTDEDDACSHDLEATFRDVVTDNCEGTYTIERTWSLVDDCGNQAADQVQIITVVDEIVPTFTAPADITLYKDEGCFVDDTPNGDAGDVIDEADNCSTGLNATYIDAVVDNCEGTYTITRMWSLVDNCGNAAEDQMQTITVLDEIVPTIDTAAADMTVECGPDNEQQLQDWLAANGNAVASDNCTSIVDWSHNYCEHGGNGILNVLVAGAPNIIEWGPEVQATLNATGLFNTVDLFTLTSVPSLALLQNYDAVLVYTDGIYFNNPDTNLVGDNLAAYIDGGGAVVDAVFDNATIPIGGAYNTPTYRVLNPAGQTSGSVRTLGTLLLPAHPILQGVTSYNGGSSSYVSTSTSLTPGSYDIALYDNGAKFIMAKENVGPANSRRVSLNMFPPSSSCSLDLWDSSTDGALIMANALNWAGNGGSPTTEPCNGVSLSDLCGATGAVTVTFTATDDCGNASTTSATFTIEDTTAPTFTAPADITLYKDEDCLVDDSPAATGDVTDEADICSGDLEATFSDVVVDNCEGTYTITRTWSLVDDCNNAALDQVQIITVLDEIVPTFTAPADITLYKDDNCDVDDSPQGDAGDVTDEADNCSTNIQATFGDVVTPGCEGTYTITRTWSLKDNCGNQAADQVQIITVLDNTAPTFTAPADITLYKDDNCYVNDTPSGDAGDVTNEADNCSTGLQATYTNIKVDNCEGTYTITRTWSLVDNCGNAAEDQVQIITVKDNTAPTFTAPADITLYKDDNCYVDDSPQGDAGDVTDEADNCSTGIDATFSDVVVDICEGSYTITRTWSLVDNCDNAAADQVQTITVLDNTPPAFFRVASDQSVQCDGLGNTTEYQEWLDTFAGAKATDNCSGQLNWSYDVISTTDDCGLTSRTLVSFTVTDDCGNSSSSSALFTIIDLIAPTIDTEASDLQVECGPNNDQELQAWLDNGGGAVASDICGGVTWSYEITASTDDCGETGSTTATFTATDDCGNRSATTSATFTIVDTTPPAIDTDAASETVECGANNEQQYLDWLTANGNASASDLCGEVSWSNQITSSTDDCGNTGSTTVIFTATDQCNNSSSTTATFTIVDTTDPTIDIAAADQTVECDGAGNTAQLDAWLTSNGGASASDTCGEVTWSNNYCTEDHSENAFTVDGDAQWGSFLNLFFLDDNYCCGFELPLVDLTSEIGPGNRVTIQPNYTSGNDVNAETNTFIFDNSLVGQSFTFSGNVTSNTLADGYQGTAWIKIFDGGFGLIEFINVPLNEGPFTVEYNNTQPGAVNIQYGFSVYGLGANDQEPGSLGSVVIEASEPNCVSLSDGCGDTGSATVTFTATDECNNSSSTTATFTIEDSTDPTIDTAATDQTVECDGTGNTAQLDAWLTSNGGATASDTCGEVTWSNNFVTLSDGCGDTGSATVIFTATDECNNSSSTTATFTIVDNTDPTIDIAAADETVLCDGQGNTAELNAWLDANGGAAASDTCGEVTWSNNYSTEPCVDHQDNGISQNIVFSEEFTNGVPASLEINANWNEFQSQLVPGLDYTKVTMSGTFDSEGISTSNPAIVASFANAISNNTEYTSEPDENGAIWHVCDRYGAEVWLNPPFTCSNLNCPSPGYIIRPAISIEFPGNSNWGGVNTATCNAPTQTMAINFQVGNGGNSDCASLSDGCGETGAATVTFTATDECGNSASTTATFTIEAEPIVVSAPENVDASACDYADQEALTAAYNEWLAEFTIASGGCIATGDFTTAPPAGVDYYQGADITLTYTATDGCSSDSATATFSVTPPPAADQLDDVVACDSYKLPELSPGNTYWTGPGRNGDLLNEGDTITSSQTLYIYAVSDNNENCFDESSFNITINFAVADQLQDVEVCESYTLPGLSDGNAYWTGTNGSGTQLFPGDVISSDQAIFIYAQSNTVPVCYAENRFTVTILDTPDVTDNVFVCSGDEYYWELSGESYYIEASPVNITLTNENGCQYNATLIIEEYKAFDIIETVEHVSCFGEADASISVEVDGGTPPYTYSWTGPGDFSADTDTVTNVAAGTYTVFVEDANGCINKRDIMVESPSQIQITSTVTPTVGDSDSGAITIDTTTGGAGEYNYNWSGDGEFTATTRDLSGLDSGFYWLQVTDANDCAEYFEFEVTEQAPAVQVTLRAMLSGPYDSNTGLMKDDLRSIGELPTVSPYIDEAITDASVFNTTGSNAIIDWVWIELRDSGDATSVITSKSALIQADGDVVETDGVTPVSFDTTQADYYIMIAHRNHLGVLTADPISLTYGDNPVVDLSTDITKVFGGVNGAWIMTDSRIALYSGDCNGDGQIQNSDRSDTQLVLGTGGFLYGDIDMNGQVQNSDIQIKLNPNIGKGVQNGASRAMDLSLFAKRRTSN